MSETIGSAMIKLSVDSDGVESGVAKAKKSISSLGDSAKKSGKDASEGIKGVGAATSDAANKIDTSTKRMIASIERQALSLGKSRSEYYAAVAAIKGNEAALGPYIKKLAEAEAAQKRHTGELIEMGKKSGLTRNQLLTMQYTINDVIASLGSGISPMTIFLQQGGQVTQAFGGIKGTLSAVGSYLANPFVLAVGAASAAIGTMAYMTNNAQDELSRFNRTLALTGNRSGLSGGAYTDLTQSVAEQTNKSISSTKEIVDKLIASGQYGREQIQQLTFSIQRFSDLSGEDADKVTDRFLKMADSPAAFAKELIKNTSIISASTVEQVRRLEEQGNKSEALRVLSKSTYDYLGKTAPEELGILTRAWNGLGRSISNAGNYLVGGSQENNIQKYRDLAAELKKAESERDSAAAKSGKDSGFFFLADKKVASLKEQLSLQKQQIITEYRTAEAQQSRTVAEKEGAAALSNLGSKYLDLVKNSTTAGQAIAQFRKELEKAKKSSPEDKTYLDAVKNQAEIEAALREKFGGKTEKAPKVPKVSEYDRLIEKLRQDVVAGYAAAETAAEGLNNAQREFRELTKGEYWATLSAGQKENLRLEAERKSAVEDLTKQLAAEEAARKRIREQSHRTAKQEADDAGVRNKNIGDYIAKLQEEAATAGLSSSALAAYRDRQILLNNGMKEGEGDWDAQLKKMTDARAKIKELNQDWKLGIKDGMQDYIDNAGLTAKNLSTTVAGAFGKMDDALTNLTMTGKLKFADLSKSIIADLIKIAIQASITKPLAEWGMSFFPSANGNAFSGGAPVTAFARGGAFTNSVVSSPTIAPMALFGEAGPEAIMPLTRLSNGKLGVQSQGGGGVVNNVSIVVNSDGSTDENANSATAKELGNRIRMVVLDVLYQERRNGGSLAGAR